ncbi:MAG TPA: Rad52/Rad22 family DNA repair protein, partial [Pyrinomonadaceae bacterium]|nr:Rad52/Rad22 family DNA repair protein [Pyrinomonadaceae bacterium]
RNAKSEIKSKDGEQKTAKTKADVSVPGQPEAADADAAQLANIGDKKMTQENLRDSFVSAEENAETSETPSNVLNFTTTLKELRKNVDPQLVKQREGWRDRNGNTHYVDYVEWHTVADILDEHAPNWGHTVKDIRPIGDIVTVTVAITIDGVTREGVGTGKTASETGIKKAEHDALKRAAVKFGIARELYKREFELIDTDESAPAADPRPLGSAVATNLGDMVTAKQLGMIRSLSREANLDAELECSQIMHCGVNELSKRAASELIDHLQNLQRKADVPMRRAG